MNIGQLHCEVGSALMKGLGKQHWSKLATAAIHHEEVVTFAPLVRVPCQLQRPLEAVYPRFSQRWSRDPRHP